MNWGFISQKTTFFIVTAVTTSNLTSLPFTFAFQITLYFRPLKTAFGGVLITVVVRLHTGLIMTRHVDSKSDRHI
jgi:hypothetical protein